MAKSYSCCVAASEFETLKKKRVNLSLILPVFTFLLSNKFYIAQSSQESCVSSQIVYPTNIKNVSVSLLYFHHALTTQPDNLITTQIVYACCQGYVKEHIVLFIPNKVLFSRKSTRSLGQKQVVYTKLF